MQTGGKTGRGFALRPIFDYDIVFSDWVSDHVKIIHIIPLDCLSEST